MRQADDEYVCVHRKVLVRKNQCVLFVLGRLWTIILESFCDLWSPIVVYVRGPESI